MTRRERYMTILMKGKADTLVWAPNFDHWLNVNRANGTVPKQYEGMSRNDIVRAVNATIWARTGILTAEQPNVRVRREEIPGASIRTTYETPVGTVETVHRYASDLTRALFLKEHMIKNVDDIRAVKFMVEDTKYTLDPEPFYQCEKEVGDDGISLVSLPVCVPFIEFGKSNAGWMRGLYLWNDHTKEVEDLLGAYADKAAEAANLLAQGPCPVIQSGDNMDELTMPPGLFKRYAVPYFKRIAKILHSGDKIFEVHWCGRTKRLLPLVPGTGIDVVEAIVPEPMTDLTMKEALDAVRGEVVIQGGIPAVLMCPQGGTRDDLKSYLRRLLETVPIGERFVLGMSDNVPPDADFDRVRMISDMVNAL
jgi:hypothetical protein